MNWTELDWIGFDWTGLNWTKLDWIRLERNDITRDMYNVHVKCTLYIVHCTWNAECHLMFSIFHATVWQAESTFYFSVFCGASLGVSLFNISCLNLHYVICTYYSMTLLFSSTQLNPIPFSLIQFNSIKMKRYSCFLFVCFLLSHHD